MNVEQKTIAGLKWTAAAKLAGQCASWVSTLLVLRLLDAQDYGLMAIVATMIGIAGAIAEFGLTASMVQARVLDALTLRRLSGVVILLHAGMAALMLIASPLLAHFYADARLSLLLQAATGQILFAAVGATPYALAMRSMNFAWLARIELATMLVGSVSTLALAALGAGVWALVGGMLVNSATRAALLVRGGENVLPSFDFTGLRPHLRYSASMASSHMLWTVVNQSDVLVGGRLLPRDALGLYSVALHLATLPMHKIMSVVNQVAFVAVARLQDDRERLRLRVLQGTRMSTAFAVGAMWGGSALAPELVPVVLGAKWAPAVPALQLVALTVPLRMVSMLTATAIGGIGAADVNLRNTLTAALVWPLCFAIGARWGATGLAAAWLAAAPLTFALNARRTCGTLGIGVAALARMALAPAAAGLAMYAAILAARHGLAPMGDAARLLLLSALGALSYTSVLLCADRQLLPDLRRLAAAARG